MRNPLIPTLLGALFMTGCGVSAGGQPSLSPMLHNTEVEYIEVGALVSATENTLVDLGPNRSYWYNGRDGSRWASERATVPASTKVLIWRSGLGWIDPGGARWSLRHVDGPRNIKRGWYGRITEIQPGANEALQVTTEDGRRFEVTGESRDDLPRLPFEVLIGEDQESIFVLEDGGELTVTQSPAA